jgi:uncharacterized delta-60 repeat protein
MLVGLCACGDAKEHPLGGDASVDVDASTAMDAGSDADSTSFSCQYSGQADIGFGNLGVTGPIFGLSNEDAGVGHVETVAFDSTNSRILIGGALEVRNGDGMQFAVAALHLDGSLDGAFGVAGKTAVGVTGYSLCWLTAIAVQSDGKIVGAGGCNDATSGHFALVRFQPNGMLDTTFGNGGTLINQPVARGQIESIAIDASDRILVTGQATLGANDNTGTKYVTARYTAAGALDGSFGSGGVAAQPFANGEDVAWDLALQDDGRIVVVGAAASATSSSFGLVRYNLDGTLDSAFGTGGAMTLPFGAAGSYALDVEVDQANRVLVIGGAAGGAGIVRLRDGQLDASFGNSGSVLLAAPIGEALATSRQDDSLYAAGFEQVVGGVRAVVGHVLPDGTLDLAFGTNGLAYASASAPASYASAVMVQPDGRVVVVGTTVDASLNYKNDFFAARFCP